MCRWRLPSPGSRGIERNLREIGQYDDVLRGLKSSHRCPHDLLDISYVDIVLDCDHALYRRFIAQHVANDVACFELRSRPHRDHSEKRLCAGCREMNLFDAGKLLPQIPCQHRFQADLFQDMVFSCRHSCKTRQKNRFLPMGDGGNLNDRFRYGRIIISRVFAEWTFHLSDVW